MANRLAHARSAYLKSAAHQPIDWYEFGEEAFAQAQAQDKPILLDIGAVWCHWCHVIDRESYDNPEIAELINQHYIAIKVDRDQRPDVDARYQQVVQSVSGQGGWPLTAFLAYDGRLIYGGTYFPPQTMKNLLTQIHQLYHQRKADIFGAHDTLTDEHVRQIELSQRDALGKAGPVEALSPVRLRGLCEDFMRAVESAMHRAYDSENGGFGTQPKFPHYSTLEYLIMQAYANPERQDLHNMLTHSLTAMANGGIYDQIMDGFHRYSVDDHWHVPHFEKMAYDNAEALTVYAQAYRLTGNGHYRQIAEGIIRWTREVLSDAEQGGFHASQDADINLEDDGDHFTWSLEELAQTLTPLEADIVQRYYGMDEAGHMHHAAGRNVLHIANTPDTLAQALSLPADDIRQHLNSAQSKMRDARRRRPMPYVDTSLYTNWNGMLIAAFFEAGNLLKLPETTQFAQRSLDRLLAEHYQAGHQVLHAADVPGFLDDYAWLAWAALKGYESTGQLRYLEACQDIAHLAQRNFEDQELGGFFDAQSTENALGLLKLKRKPVDDSPSSSPTAILLRVLNALYLLTENTDYRTSVDKGLNLSIHQNGQYGLFVSALATAAHHVVNPPLKLDVPKDAEELIEAARDVFFPGKLLSYRESDGSSEARICVGMQCLAPVTTAKELHQQVQLLCGPGRQPA